MIKGISITNFKGIGDPGVSLDLEPVTLLFGQNSAGKSTIFHAFLYAYEVLVNRNYDVDRTTLGGASVDLGGFLSFVHDHEPNNTVSIEIDLDLASAQLDKEWRIAESLVGTKENEVDLSALGTDVWSAKVGFTVAWKTETGCPYVSRFTVDIDEERLLAIWTEQDTDEINSNVNYRHPVFRWPNEGTPGELGSAGVLDSLYPAFQTVTDQWFWGQGEELTEDNLDDRENEGNDEEREGDTFYGKLPSLDEDLSSYRVVEDVDNASLVRYYYRYNGEKRRAVLEGAVFIPGPDWNPLEAVKEWKQRQEIEQQDLFRPTQILEQADALPPFDRPLQLNLAPALETETRDLIRDVVTRLALGPTRLLARELEAFRHIGPLREIPPRSFQRTLSPDPARWCSGLAGWDVLSASNDEFVDRVSLWLTSRLNTGYSLIRRWFKELELDGYIMRILKQENPLDDLPLALEGIEKLPERSRLLVRDDDSLVEVDPPDIAVGITQLVPVIVAALDDHDGVTLIEQPELHNHPAVEVGLGDLFIETIKQEHCRFILETHGEHLILRMLRRIREATEGELPEGVKGLSPDQVAVYFVERNTDGVTTKRLRIDETGEFMDRWPKGFFEERAEELF